MSLENFYDHLGAKEQGRIGVFFFTGEKIEGPAHQKALQKNKQEQDKNTGTGSNGIVKKQSYCEHDYQTKISFQLFVHVTQHEYYQNPLLYK